jgi:hypothetical protein
MPLCEAAPTVFSDIALAPPSSLTSGQGAYAEVIAVNGASISGSAGSLYVIDVQQENGLWVAMSWQCVSGGSSVLRWERE